MNKSIRKDILQNKWYWNQFEKLSLDDYLNIKYALYLRKCEDLKLPCQSMDEWLEETTDNVAEKERVI